MKLRTCILSGQPCQVTIFATVRAHVIYCVMFVCTVPIVWMPSSPVSGICCAEQHPFSNQSDLCLISKGLIPEGQVRASLLGPSHVGLVLTRNIAMAERGRSKAWGHWPVSIFNIRKYIRNLEKNFNYKLVRLLNLWYSGGTSWAPSITRLTGTQWKVFFSGDTLCTS